MNVMTVEKQRSREETYGQGRLSLNSSEIYTGIPVAFTVDIGPASNHVRLSFFYFFIYKFNFYKGSGVRIGFSIFI